MAHLLEVNDLQTHFPTRAGLVRAVDGVSFYLDRGELPARILELACMRQAFRIETRAPWFVRPAADAHAYPPLARVLVTCCRHVFSLLCVVTLFGSRERLTPLPASERL